MNADSVGKTFARAMAAKDREGLLDVLSSTVDFRAMTPNRFWEAKSAATVVDDVVLGSWFDENDRIEGLDQVVHDQVADRDRIGYQLRVTTPQGAFLVEQQAYYAVEDGRITWLRVMCSGFRPLATS